MTHALPSPTLVCKAETETAADVRINEVLSKHYLLSEMVLSATAIKYGLPNTPDSEAINNLRLLCENILEPLRSRFGVLRITSAFRSKKVNELVGGVRNSQHLTGQAVDIYVPNCEVGAKMFYYIKENLAFDQLIYEFSRNTGKQIIHVSYNAENNRMQCLTHYEMNN